MVPETLDKDEAERRPTIVGRQPDPIWVVSDPVPGPPEVTILLVDPAAGYVRAVIVRRGRGRAFVDRRRRRGYVGHLFLIDRGPVAGNPLPAVLQGLPVARDPLPIGRGDAPESAHPNEVLLPLVPAPIAGNPYHVFPFGFLIGRHFVNGLGRLLVND